MKLFNIFKKSKKVSKEESTKINVDIENFRNCTISKYNILDGNGLIKYESPEEKCIMMTNIKRWKDMDDYFKVVKDLAEESGYKVFMQDGLGYVTAGISRDVLMDKLCKVFTKEDVQIINRCDNATLDNYRGYPEVL